MYNTFNILYLFLDMRNNRERRRAVDEKPPLFSNRPYSGMCMTLT